MIIPWSDIIAYGVKVLIALLVSIAGVYIGKVINKYVKNDKVKQVLLSFTTLVSDCVKTVNQDFVSGLKKTGTFTSASKTLALQKCIEMIKENLTDAMKTWLNENVVDLDAYLKIQVESALVTLKGSLK